MESKRKPTENLTQERPIKKNGLFVHYNFPKLLKDVTEASLRRWVLNSEEGKLERAVLSGHGRRMLAETDTLPQHLVQLISKCEALHAAVEKGSLLELKGLLEMVYNRMKCVACYDVAGVGLLHKAVFYDYMDIVQWLVENFPQLVQQRDSEGRTPLHYTAVSRSGAWAAALLEGAGAARGARDAAGRTLAHHRAARTLLALPAADMPQPAKNPPGLAIKRHNIRIWCHECDMGKLQRVVWEGHGTRLLSEVSNQPIVRRFLEAVPYIMNTIREVHNAVIQNDLEGLMRFTADPVSPQVLSGRDVNGMTAFHKAAGLGHCGILKYIIEKYPQGINSVDSDGRTPLHYAATVRDEQHTYNTLVELGADESIVDNKNKSPGYYINRPQEIDKSSLKVLPEAPRTPSSAYPSSWDWKLLDADFIKKPRKKNLKASNENISSKNNTNTTSETIESQPNVMKNSSTHELISTLPELDDTEKSDAKTDEKYEEIAKKDDEAMEEVEGTLEDSARNDKHNDNTNHLEDDNAACTHDANNDTTTHDVSNDENTGENSPNADSGEINADDTSEVKNIGDSAGGHSSPRVTDDSKTENEEENKEKDHHIIDDNQEQNDKSRNEGSENDDIFNESINDTENNGEKVSDQIENKSDEVNLEEITNENENSDVSNEQKEVIHRNEVNAAKSAGEKITNGNLKNVNNSVAENAENADVMAEDTGTKGEEGNNNTNSNEDDDDVQVQDKSHIEDSDVIVKCTVDVSENNNAKGDNNAPLGNLINGRNTQESLIEGIIRGDAEQDSQDASMNVKDATVHGEILIVDNEIDPEVTDLINNANMEMLATLVLNGEGSRLIGRRSQNAELQSFLENVPIYMQKIKRIHVAAKEGNIRDLQTALDRRKFAIARDPISPNGATPLHVATVFGKTNIIKYLGGRFPETLSAVDFEGRTALHYAAVIPDNGHYYNLLQQLGANTKDLDDNGRSAEDYLSNRYLLPYEQLFADYGITEEAARRMLSDKVPEDHFSSRRSLDTPEALDTLDRCYRLLASARPSRTPLSASSNKATPPFVLGRFLKRQIFEILRHRITILDHDLFDVIWPAVKKLPDNKNIIQTVEEDFPGGVTAPDYCVYEVFQEFLLPLIKDLHNINVNSELPIHPTSDFDTRLALSTSGTDSFLELNIDPIDEFVLSGTIECSRNLLDFELPLNLKVGKLEKVERVITTILMHKEFSNLIEQFNPDSNSKKEGSTYYTLNEVLEKPSEICATLAANGLLVALCDQEEIDDSTRLHGTHWPYGRGVFVSSDKTIAIWINVHDHLRVLISTPPERPGEIGVTYSKLSFIMYYLHDKLDFVWHQKLGHLSSRPTYLGIGMRLSLIINFPCLSKDADNMKHLCAARGLQYRETSSAEISRISNYQCLSITESRCFNDFTSATSNLLHLERDLSMQNSTHITAMLTNIFRKKRSSITE